MVHDVDIHKEYGSLELFILEEIPAHKPKKSQYFNIYLMLVMHSWNGQQLTYELS
jgi:hypothetical protein